MTTQTSPPSVDQPLLQASPALIPSGPVTITYNYDKLSRLTAADYSNGDYYHYGYDAVGDRLSQEMRLNSVVSNTTYTYDDANRIQTVNNVPYVYDNNGNLKNDGVNNYQYDKENRLILFSNSTTSATYRYNGLGDRLKETVGSITTTFTMDLNAGLTQALSDGTHNYGTLPHRRRRGVVLRHFHSH